MYPYMTDQATLIVVHNPSTAYACCVAAGITLDVPRRLHATVVNVSSCASRWPMGVKLVSEMQHERSAGGGSAEHRLA